MKYLVCGSRKFSGNDGSSRTSPSYAVVATVATCFDRSRVTSQPEVIEKRLIRGQSSEFTDLIVVSSQLCFAVSLRGRRKRRRPEVAGTQRFLVGEREVLIASVFTNCTKTEKGPAVQIRAPRDQ
jgi:hypothetical protein